jgi:hypothetical protein
MITRAGRLFLATFKALYLQAVSSFSLKSLLLVPFSFLLLDLFHFKSLDRDRFLILLLVEFLQFSL